MRPWLEGGGPLVVVGARERLGVNWPGSGHICLLHCPKFDQLGNKAQKAQLSPPAPTSHGGKRGQDCVAA